MKGKSQENGFLSIYTKESKETVVSVIVMAALVIFIILLGWLYSTILTP